jgi:hypothetical protein
MTRRLNALMIVAVLAGLAGCAYQDPLRVPDPYRTGDWGPRSDSYSFYGGFGGYSPYYGYGMTDPFYYRYGYPTYGYPAYGYRYPYPPYYYCADVNRDGRCDRKPSDHDNDGDDDGNHHGRGNGPIVNEPGRDRDHDGRFIPRNPDRMVPDGRGLVPDSGGKNRPVPRADSSSSSGAAGMVPRAVPAPPKQAPAAPVAPRGNPRADDSPAPPKVRPVDR